MITEQELISLPGLRAVMKRQGFDTVQLAWALDVDEKRLHRLTYLPHLCGATLETAEALADVLGVSLWELEVGA